MNIKKISMEQLIHLLFGVLFFLIIATTAVGLDLLSSFVDRIGVSRFTARALELTAHVMLILDLVLFLVYLVIAARDLIKGMMK